MTLVDRILAELENGPARNAELMAVITDVPAKSIVGTTSNLSQQGRIIVAGKVQARCSRGGRKEAIYALPGTPPVYGKPKVKQERVERVIADNEYAFATSRTFANYVFPGKGSRRGL